MSTLFNGRTVRLVDGIGGNCDNRGRHCERGIEAGPYDGLIIKK